MASSPIEELQSNAYRSKERQLPRIGLTSSSRQLSCHASQEEDHQRCEQNDINGTRKRCHRYNASSTRIHSTRQHQSMQLVVVTLSLWMLLLGSTVVAWTNPTANSWRNSGVASLPSSSLSFCLLQQTTASSSYRSARPTTCWLPESPSSLSSSRPFALGPLAATGRRGRPPGKSNTNSGKSPAESAPASGDGGEEGEDDMMLMDMMMMDDLDPEAAAAAAAAAAASDQDVEELLLAANLNEEEEVASVFEDDEEEGDEEVQEDNDEDDDDDDDLIVEVEDFEDDEEEEEEEEESLVSAEYYDGGDNGEYEDVTTKFFEDMEGVLKEWDAGDDAEEYPLEDEPSDPNYQRQKQLLEETTKATDQWRREEQFDDLDYIMNRMTPEEAEQMEQTPFQRQVEERARKVILTEQDVLDYLKGDENNLEREVARIPDLMDDDPYPRHDTDGVPNLLEQDIGVTDDDMEALDNAWKTIRRAQKMEPWDKVTFKDMNTDWDNMANETLDEMEACLEELGGSAYNVTRWLNYDLDFNVSNLFLAAVKHNPRAPVLFQHWYPQLVTYKRYQHVRDRNFDYTWDDVEQADISELERYYAGFGYDEIPSRAPADTGIINVDELEEEELRMAAFENWMADVYNPELDRKDFDDDEIRDEDNVFSAFYDPPQHPDLPTYEDALDDIKDWVEDTGGDFDVDDEEAFDENEDWSEDNPDEKIAYRNLLGRDYKYKVIRDDEFTKLFRGHLIVACTAEEEDLEVAEKITLRMEEQFGKQVFVETRVMAHARPEDNVFEVWLESYEIDLLHSKKRAMSNNKNWKGPAECDDKQIDYLVDRVGFLISDESRYSYRMEVEAAE